MQDYCMYIYLKVDNYSYLFLDHRNIYFCWKKMENKFLTKHILKRDFEFQNISILQTLRQQITCYFRIRQKKDNKYLEEHFLNSPLYDILTNK